MIWSAFVSLVLTTNTGLDSARALAAELRFEEAATQLELARKQPSLMPGERIELLQLLAKCQVALGHWGEAENAYSELLSLEPDVELPPKSSPKIVGVFDAVKKRLYPDQKVELVEVPAPPGRVSVRLVDPYRKAARAGLFTKRGDAPWMEEVVVLSRRSLDFAVPQAPGVTVRWYALVLDTSGQTVASLGGRDAPRVVEVMSVAVMPPPAPEIRATQVGGLVAAIVAVAAAGISIGFQVRSTELDRAARDNSTPPGSWSDTARATHRRAQQDASVSAASLVAAGASGVTSAVLFAW
jgi:hypothetical protein